MIDGQMKRRRQRMRRKAGNEKTKSKKRIRKKRKRRGVKRQTRSRKGKKRQVNTRNRKTRRNNKETHTYSSHMFKTSARRSPGTKSYCLRLFSLHLGTDFRSEAFCVCVCVLDFEDWGSGGCGANSPSSHSLLLCLRRSVSQF